MDLRFLLCWSALIVSMTPALILADQFLVSEDDPRTSDPSLSIRLGDPVSNEVMYGAEAVAKLPSVLACLKNGSLDLLDFEWAALSTDEELRLCLSYVGDTLGGPDGMTAWFEAQNMTVTTIESHSTPKTVPSSRLFARFPDKVLNPCTFYSILVQPILNRSLDWVFGRTWNVREDAFAHGVTASFYRDGSAGRPSINRLSCFN